jgi:predicted DsbA family dithiol-disulfide isomerase
MSSFLPPRNSESANLCDDESPIPDEFLFQRVCQIEYICDIISLEGWIGLLHLHKAMDMYMEKYDNVAFDLQYIPFLLEPDYMYKCTAADGVVDSNNHSFVESYSNRIQRLQVRKQKEQAKEGVLSDHVEGSIVLELSDPTRVTPSRLFELAKEVNIDLSSNESTSALNSRIYSNTINAHRLYLYLMQFYSLDIAHTYLLLISKRHFLEKGNVNDTCVLKEVCALSLKLLIKEEEALDTAVEACMSFLSCTTRGTSEIINNYDRMLNFDVSMKDIPYCIIDGRIFTTGIQHYNDILQEMEDLQVTGIIGNSIFNLYLDLTDNEKESMARAVTEQEAQRREGTV